MRVRSLAFVAVFAVTCPASPGAAQDDRSSIEVARARMEQGQAYYLQGRFGEAAAEFEAAYEAEPFSAFLYNAAVSYENAGEPARALDFFQRYLERDPRASDRAAVEQRMARLRAAVEALRTAVSAGSQPGPESGAGGDASSEAGTQGGAVGVGSDAGAGEPSATGQGSPMAAPTTPAAPPPDSLPEDFKSLVSVRSTPEGATVVIATASGTEVTRGYSPFSYTLERGQYHLRIEHPDYHVAENDINVEPGHVYVVVANLSQGEFLGYLRVISQPPGAQVFIDEREAGPRGQTPFEGPVPVGNHRVWIERPGYQAIEREAEVGVGDHVELRVALERVSFGRIRVLSNVRGAVVRIDGQRVGAVPYDGELPAGTHRVRVESDGMKAFERDVEIQRGQLTPVRVRLRPDVGRAGAWVAGVFGLLSVGGGVVLGLMSEDLRTALDAEARAGRLAANDPRLDHGLYFAIGADAAFGLAALLGAVALYYALYDPNPPSDGAVLEPRDWAFAPLGDPSSGMVGGALTGRF